VKSMQSRAPFQCIAHIPDPFLREESLCSEPGRIPRRGGFVGLSVCRFSTARRQTDKNHPPDRFATGARFDRSLHS
jgi:hypothetical protein